MARQGRSATSKAKRVPVVIVGAGRLGGALALALQAKRWPVRVHSRDDAGRERTRALGLKPATVADLKKARVCVLCVPDAAVPSVSEALSRELPRTVALVHTAGALPLSVLGTQRGRAVGSFHPLCAVSSVRDSLAGHTAAISTRSPALRALLQRMAEDVGLAMFDVPEAHRAAYHAGAVLSAGGLVSLADAAVGALGAAGIEPEAALKALLPLMRSALRGIEARGLSGGLTGPIVRGDAGVVAAHLAALPSDIAPLYAQLSRRALRLASGRLQPEPRAALEALLAKK
ncbi:Rossmann-like and DUF2520 domain-containing protein [Corallococcus caeni]|uniref:Rossmann-like and DUF2520 domain-containing protein n=1 Tax=Corallococcus caeni TaxID=3082388 RepID=UPI0030C6E81C